MAKKAQRISVGLVCETCGSQNYVTERNKLNTEQKLGFRKYCNTCRKHTQHKEKTKLH